VLCIRYYLVSLCECACMGTLQEFMQFYTVISHLCCENVNASLYEKFGKTDESHTQCVE